MKITKTTRTSGLGDTEEWDVDMGTEFFRVLIGFSVVIAGLVVVVAAVLK